ncbi:DinB family protein [Paenibacillus thermotolerans]|uniref:DinB family protein n=1 Tax=Paenibacillus thermotolerans TaxID=3027807 RepID=UPI002367FC9A|nr:MULTISPECIES: DinB family protein [unclassified Paenibacillus]
MTSPFQSMIKHMIWANERIIRRLSECGNAPAGAVRWMSHILGAEKVWLARLHGEDASALPIWPELSLSECAAAAGDNAARFERLAERLDEAELQRLAIYRNSTGTEFRTSVADMLTQVLMHGSYHRGQINAALRGAGFEPVGVDYIMYARERQ